MKHEIEVKEALIENTIALSAKGGFEAATTRAITTGGVLPCGAKLNEVYIYRLFGSKENLYASVFAKLDEEVFDNFKKIYVVVNAIDLPLREKIMIFLERAWQFLLQNEPKFRCYVRCYYSVYFTAPAFEAHRKLFSSIVNSMSSAFKEEADVLAILHIAFSTLLNFAISVYNGELADDDANRPHIFNVVYCTMATYFKDAPSLFGVDK